MSFQTSGVCLRRSNILHYVKFQTVHSDSLETACTTTVYRKKGAACELVDEVLRFRKLQPKSKWSEAELEELLRIFNSYIFYTRILLTYSDARVRASLFNFFLDFL